MPPPTSPFQERVREWILSTFGPEIAQNKVERCDRLIEEVFELVQSLGYDRTRIHMLEQYVFERPVGDPEQELGGVMNTVRALANAVGLNVDHAADKELARCWEKAEAIREKQRTKPKGPLPQ